jgi:hypothetical protein
VEVKEQYQVKISNMLAAFENFYEDEDINRAWEHTKKNTKASATESVIMS